MEKPWKFLLKPILKVVQILNSPIATKETVSVINLLTKKAPGPQSFIGEFYQTFRETTISMLDKLLQQVKKGETAQLIS